MFVSFLYMFQATMCPSSGETTVFMRHLIFVILLDDCLVCRVEWYQTVNRPEWQVPSVA